jgi:hypothetical protein
MPTTIKAQEKNLDNVFCRDYLFEIPVFQRPYAWTTEEVDDLLDDLLSAMQRGAEEPYFLGSIVLIKGDNAPSEVVDGQQRLTTLTMLLCSLRELSDGQLRADLDKRVRQQSDTLSGTEEVVRLRLRSLDEDFFYRHIQSEGGIENLVEVMTATETDSQQRIVENVKFLHKKLAQLEPNERRELAAFVITQCYMVVVSSPDISSAYRIFAVMNDRGLDLSATDILKAEIIGELPNEDQRNQYAQKWEDIEQELGRDRFGALFTHVRMIYGKAKQRRSLQDEFKEQVLSQHSSTEFIDHVLDEYYDVYKRVLGLSQDSLEGSQTYHRHLEHLRRLDNVDWIPPAMAFFHRNQQNGALLDKFTRDLERLAYSLFIRRANVNERINRYAAVLRDLDVNDDLWRDDGPLQLNADEKRATLQVLEGPIYTLPRVPLPLLLRVDSLLASAGATYNYSIMSIEHVLPQNPAKDSDWMAWFPEEDERTQWTHRLANLVLLSSRKNARASNFSFDHKKAEYFLRGGTSPFALTTQVVGESEWTPKVLKRRQSELIQKLKEEWRLA